MAPSRFRRPGLAALIFLAALPVFSAEDKPPADPARSYPRETVANIDAWIPLHCRDEVRSAFVRIWESCRKGRSEKECAFRIDSVPQAGGATGIEIVMMGPDVTPDQDDAFVRVVDVARGRTLAIAHTHPIATEPGLGLADDQVPVSLNYVISGRNRGLYVWDRDLGSSRRPLRSGLTWRDPCTEKDLAKSREELRRLRDQAASRTGTP